MYWEEYTLETGMTKDCVCVERPFKKHDRILS